MKLYLLRHADALEGADDELRPLSDRGKAQCKQIGTFCKHAGIVFDAAYTSPLVRARKTAELILDTTNLTRPIDVVESECLLNETSADAFCEWLDTLPGVKHVLMVGHLPSLAAGREAVCRSFEMRRFEPQEAAKWDKAYERLEKLLSR